ncbi:hypothetical protein ACFQS7_19070 [Dankookia sp. GCM10030260]|uniref:hypothetical protein n=1 Tax=Dankookia sp. GCM10030260 TaxID=3273390 RepID=UPI00360BFD71
MGALASLATLAGAGASIYGNVRQAQQQGALNRAQVGIAQQQDAQQRQLTLAKTIATTRARLASGGVAPDAGSAAALAAGLTQEAAAAQGADDATLRARLAQGRISLLNPDGTFNALLQSGRTLGSVTRSLLD